MPKLPAPDFDYMKPGQPTGNPTTGETESSRPNDGGTSSNITDPDTLTDAQKEELYNQQQDAMNEGHGVVTSDKKKAELLKMQLEAGVLDKSYNDVPILNLSDDDVKDFISSMCSVSKSRTYTPIKYYERSGYKTGGTEFYDQRRYGDKYNLRLGDSVFYIPPEFITVSETSSTVREPSIRSTSTIKKKYGYSSTDISIKLMFNGDNQINGFPVTSPFEGRPYYIDGLRPFLAQCRVSPILAIENEFLNRTCGMYSMVVQNVQIRTVPGFPKLLECVIMGIEFDSSSYTMVPIWEYSNLIEWDLYRYNYQRLLNTYISEKVASPIEDGYMLKEVKSFVMDGTFDIYMPDDERMSGYEATELEDMVLDMKTLKYKKLLSNKDDDFIVTNMSFGFENIIVSPKLSNFNKATTQYLGGGDSAITVQIATRNENTAKEFKSLIGKSQYLIKKLKDVSGLGFVSIDNDFLSLIGSKYLLIDSVTVETVPSFPGLFSISIQATSNDVHSNRVEDIKGFRPFFENRDGTKNDTIGQNQKGLLNKISQEVYAEYKMNEIDMYPDLFLPNYDEIDLALPLINKYRTGRGMPKIPLDKYPRRVSTTTLYGQAYVMENRVDPDFYFMYPGLDFSKMTVKASDLVTERDVAAANVNHIYKNVEPPYGGGIFTGEDTPGNELLNAPGTDPTSTSKLGIKCARGVDRAFLDFLLAKVGCAYVFGANGQYVYAFDDPNWTQANEDRLNSFGGPVLDRWRTGVQAFDCSGFVGYGMYRCGYFKTVPRQGDTVFMAYCDTISKSELLPGDIIRHSGHIAVYIGGGKTVEAMGKNHGVKIGNLGNRFNWFGRCRWKPEIIREFNSIDNNSAGGNQQIGRAMPFAQRMPTMRTHGNQVVKPGDESDEIFGDTSNPSLQPIRVGKLGGSFDLYDDIILEKSKKHGLNPNWVKALMRQESAMVPTAKSRVARGLMQLTDICCKHLGIPFDERMYDPEYNTEWGCKYYKEMVVMFDGNYKHAAGAYNRGPYGFKTDLAGTTTMPRETVNHMAAVQKNYDTLIGAGGTTASPDGTESSTTTPDTSTPPKTTYVEKKHGNRTEQFSGKFGVPLIIDSPINALMSVNLTPGLDVAMSSMVGVELDRKKGLYSNLEEVQSAIETLKASIKKDFGAPPTPVVHPDTDANAAETSAWGAYHAQVDATTDRFNKYHLLGSTVDECTYGCRGTMLKAFPTFSFLISTDSTQWFDGRKMWNNYYPYRAVMGMSITHDHEQPMGTAYIKASNLSQNLTKRPKVEYKSILTDPEYEGGIYIPAVGRVFNVNKFLYKHYGFIIGSPKVTESMVDSNNTLVDELKLAAGARIHIRMGYGNSYADLPVIFNGTVAEVTTGEYVEIVAQSDGAELINNIISSDVAKTNGVMKLQQEASNIVTSLIIDRASWTNMLSDKWGEASEYNIEHFGLFMGKNEGGIFNKRELEYDICKNVYLANYKQKLYCAMETHDVFDDEDGVEFALFNRTPWDAMNLVTQIMPEFICYPMYHMFDTRVFYGLPSWMTRYRYDITPDLKVQEYCKSFSQIHIANMNDIIDNRTKVSSKFLTTNAICTYVRGNDAQTDVECTSTMFADRDIDWAKQKTKVIDTSIQQNYFGPDAFYEWLSFNEGVTNAESIAVTSLLESFSKSYYDEVIMLGNPTIKPYDELFIDDIYGEMYGLTRVNRVVHSFTSDTGFTTSVTPGMITYHKSEDSGATNSYRNKVNLLDLACGILGGRFQSNDIVANYKQCIYEFIDEDGLDIEEYMMDAVINLKPIITGSEFTKGLVSKAEAVHSYKRKEYLVKVVSYKFRENSDFEKFGRNFTRYVARLPLLRSVVGYFANKNVMGIRPVLHKGRPFVSGTKGSTNLIDGYGYTPDYDSEV